MNNIEREQLARNWNKKRNTAMAIGVGEMVGPLVYGLCHNHIVGTDDCCIIPMLTIGGIGLIKSAIAFVSLNPYDGSEILQEEPTKEETQAVEEKPQVYTKKRK